MAFIENLRTDTQVGWVFAFGKLLQVCLERLLVKFVSERVGGYVRV